MTELTPGARALLDVARRAPPAPSEEAIERMERGVLLTVAAAAASGAAGAATAKGVWTAVLSKLLLGGALLVVGGVVGAAMVRVEPPPRSVRAESRTEPDPPRSVRAESRTEPELPVASAPPPRSVRAESRTEPEPSVIMTPSTPLGETGVLEENAAPPSVLPTSGELALLRSALEHLDAREWSEGLAQLDRHDIEFPEGPLQTEADVLRVLGLCGQDRVSSALELAATVRARSPNAPALARLSSSCVNP